MTLSVTPRPFLPFLAPRNLATVCAGVPTTKNAHRFLDFCTDIRECLNFMGFTVLSSRLNVLLFLSDPKAFHVPVIPLCMKTNTIHQSRTAVNTDIVKSR